MLNLPSIPDVHHFMYDNCVMSHMPGILEDDRLTRKLDNTDQMLADTKQMMAILSAILLVCNTFQSASGLSNLEAKQKAFDFKLKLLVYYFNQRPPGLPPPGLPSPPHAQPLPSFTMQCMISKLSLDSSIVEAAHILPTASSRVSFVPYWYVQQRDM